VRLVDVGRAVEDGQHQPAAEEQLHVRPQREPEAEMKSCMGIDWFRNPRPN
jgi:hypothetical protein